MNTLKKSTLNGMSKAKLAQRLKGLLGVEELDPKLEDDRQLIIQSILEIQEDMLLEDSKDEPDGKEELSSSPSFERAIEEVNSTDLIFEDLEFPIAHKNDNNFVDSKGRAFKLGYKGVAYMAIVTGDKKHRAELLELYNSGMMQELADFVNNYKHRWEGHTYTASIMNGEVLATMRNYNEVKHEELLEMIKDQGMDNLVTYSNLNEDAMVLWLKARSSSQARKTFNPGTPSAYADDYVFGLKIENGHSGRISLRYRIGLWVGSYERSWSYKGTTRRHLSKVDEAVDGLQQAMQEANESLVTDRLIAMSRADAVSLTMTVDGSKRVKELQAYLLADKSMNNAIEVIEWLGKKGRQRGYGSASTKLIDKIIDSVI